jgi:NAD(P)-dependent dehydrogenase (short-subunit alcohol dehydrogenase family)
MSELAGRKALITGGSRGLGLAIAEALVANGAQVTVLARDPAKLAEVRERLGVAVIQGDITDEALAKSTLRELKPELLVLNAGAKPGLGLLHEQSWESFSNTWDTDVKGGFHWLQAALASPLPRGSRVLIGSSGAAVNGSPLSGGYAGSKRMLWFMAQYANASAKELGLDIQFQAIVPQQMIGETALGRAGAEGYARRKGVSVEALLAGFGAPMPPSKVGEHVISILTDAKYRDGVAFGLKGDTGIVSLGG